MSIPATQARAPTFYEEVIANTPGTSNLEKCIQCGTCGGNLIGSPKVGRYPECGTPFDPTAQCEGDYKP